MIIAIAGLPGTGRSTLAHALAEQLGDDGVLERDYLGRHLFSASRVGPGDEQDHFVVDVMLKTTAWRLERDPESAIILDGLPLTRIRQVTSLQRFADHLRQQLHVIECVCAERLALGRLAAKRAAGRHWDDQHVDAEFYYARKEHAELIPQPKLIVDTALPPDECLALALRFVLPTSTTARRTASATSRAGATAPA